MHEGRAATNRSLQGRHAGDASDERQLVARTFVTRAFRLIARGTTYTNVYAIDSITRSIQAIRRIIHDVNAMFHAARLFASHAMDLIRTETRRVARGDERGPVRPHPHGQCG